MNDIAPLVPSETQTAFVVAGMSRGLQIFFDETRFNTCIKVAKYLAAAEGFCPRHLMGKPEACFAVVSRSLTWNLDPYGVAQATYQTPGGQVGYYGSLCQAIIENSGRLDGGIRYEYYGEWNRIRGKFAIRTSDKGTKYPAATWEPKDEEGLGIRVLAQVKGEVELRTLEFDLKQAFPRNSTLWATDPQTQIRYTAIRRFATSVVPTLFLGVPMENDGLGEWVETMRDVTPPRPVIEPEPPPIGHNGGPAITEVVEPPAPAVTQAAEPPAKRTRKRREEPVAPSPKPFAFADMDGVVHEYDDPDDAVTAFSDLLSTAAGNIKHVEAIWENGAMLITALRDSGLGQDADMLNQTYADICDELENQGGGGREGELPPEMEPNPSSDPEPEPEPDPPPPAPEPDPPPPPQTAKADPLFVPVDSTIQAWFGPARVKVKQLLDAKEPPEVFKKFRAVNAEALRRLDAEFRSWFNILDKILAGAETGP